MRTWILSVMFPALILSVCQAYSLDFILTGKKYSNDEFSSLVLQLKGDKLHKGYKIASLSDVSYVYGKQKEKNSATSAKRLDESLHLEKTGESARIYSLGSSDLCVRKSSTNTVYGNIEKWNAPKSALVSILLVSKDIDDLRNKDLLKPNPEMDKAVKDFEGNFKELISSNNINKAGSAVQSGISNIGKFIKGKSEK